MIKILETKNDKEWNGLIDKLETKCIYYTAEYAKVNEANSKEKSELFFFGDEDGYVVYPYLKKEINKLLFFQNQKAVFYDTISFEYGGPAVFVKDKSRENGLFEGFLKAFHEYCLQNNIISELVRLHPFIENHVYYERFMPENTKKIHDIVYVDLAESEETIWNNFPYANRKAIRKAKNNNIQIVVSNKTEELDRFRELYFITMDKWNARKDYYYTLSYFQDLFVYLEKHTALFLAKLEEKIIVGSLLLHKYDIGYDYLRGSDADYLGMRPNNLIVYEKILWLKRQGYKYFVMGGGYKTNDSIFSFKSLFSRKVKPFYRYSLIHNNEQYDYLCKLRKEHEKSGLVAEPDFFPFYRSP